MNPSADTALILIDVQNDYFPDGRFPLWNTDNTLTHTLATLQRARASQVPIILVQHVADSAKGEAPFFNSGTPGVDLHSAIQRAAPDAHTITKQFADSFEQTTLHADLQERGIKRLLLGGMMTQNCVTHTALSKQAEHYTVSVLSDCCTSVDAMIHGIAINALTTRVGIGVSGEVLGGVIRGR
ncbi:MAG TPA: cysteine hydrolase [Gammaproteobacteria bacterium]|jgi:nicotinamidase-related amidase|nr:cysteine hydrolase [Gammaproteobacteria bacterium]